MKEFLIVVEKTETGYSAYSPDLPGCVSTGHSPQEIEASMREAIQLHLEGLREEGYDIPDPSTYSAYIRVTT